MKNFLLLVAIILSFAFDANADETSAVICKIVNYTHTLDANYGLADEERVGNGRFFAL